MNLERSSGLYSEALELTPRGVSSPVRAFAPFPLFAAGGKGCRVTDADGNVYIDMCMAYGPLILGHAHPRILSAASEQMKKGTVYGMPSEPELGLLKRLTSRIPCAGSVRLTNSGTEAAMHAVRLARGYTGKNGIVKIDGGFHGSSDALMVNGDGGTHAFSSGIPKTASADTHTVRFNETRQLEDLLGNSGDIAAVIMEPIMGNMGVIPPKKGYLGKIRKITSENGVLLIFDEVITGLRVSPGGAQELYGVTPDICVLGKIIGGGFPVGAVAGKKEIMENFAPMGTVYEAGTFSGNPVTAAAGCAAIDALTPDVYSELRRMTDVLVNSVYDMTADSRTQCCIQSSVSMFQIFFGTGPVRNAADARNADTELYRKMFGHMLDSGIYLPPAAMEVNFLSAAHDRCALSAFTDAFETFLRSARA